MCVLYNVYFSYDSVFALCVYMCMYTMSANFTDNRLSFDLLILYIRILIVEFYVIVIS